MNPIEKLLSVALAEVGYKEKLSNKDLDDKKANAGPGNWTKYARDLDRLGDVYNGRKNGYAWCDVFVDWCFVQAFGHDKGLAAIFQPLKGCGAGCGWSYKYYQRKNRICKEPKPGDQIFFAHSVTDVYHTGIVYKVVGNLVYTIEGNHGDGVAQACYSKTAPNILGYGRPDYVSLDEENSVPWYAEEREWALKMGLTVEGERPNDSMTRAEVWTTCRRLYNLIKGGDN